MDTKSENEIDNIDYKVDLKTLGKIFAIFGSVFILTFVLNFPIIKLTEDKIRTLLAGNRSCPITFDKMSLSFLLPKVVLENVNILGQCIDKQQDIVLEKAETKILGPSFSPLGIATQSNFDFLGNHLEVLFSQGISSSMIKLNDQTIKLNTIRDLMDTVNLRGNLNINSLLELINFEIKSGNLFLKSKDLAIGSMNISGFNTPSLDINHFSLKGVISNGVLVISDLIIGDKKSPIRANFKGKIEINNRNIMISKIDLKGEIQFSKDLTEKLFIIDQFLKSYNKKDNFYLIQLKGTLSYVTPSTY